MTSMVLVYIGTSSVYFSDRPIPYPAPTCGDDFVDGTDTRNRPPTTAAGAGTAAVVVPVGATAAVGALPLVPPSQLLTPPTYHSVPVLSVTTSAPAGPRGPPPLAPCGPTHGGRSWGGGGVSALPAAAATGVMAAAEAAAPREDRASHLSTSPHGGRQSSRSAGDAAAATLDALDAIFADADGKESTLLWGGGSGSAAASRSASRCDGAARSAGVAAAGGVGSAAALGGHLLSFHPACVTPSGVEDARR